MASLFERQYSTQEKNSSGVNYSRLTKCKGMFGNYFCDPQCIIVISVLDILYNPQTDLLCASKRHCTRESKWKDHINASYCKENTSKFVA